MQLGSFGRLGGVCMRLKENRMRHLVFFQLKPLSLVKLTDSK